MRFLKSDGGNTVAGVVLLLLVGVTFGAVAVLALPHLEIGLESVMNGETEYVEGQPVVFSSSQVEDLNKVYEDRRDEYAFCLTIEEDSPVDMRHPVRVFNASSTHAHFECLSSSNGLVHTYPGPHASAEPSLTDKVELVRLYEVSCIMSEEVLDEEVWNPRGLTCYINPLPQRGFSDIEEIRKSVSEIEFEQVDVAIQENKGEGQVMED